jgi:hypothetical protein
MGMPNVPDVDPKITLTRNEVINLLLSSVALEELGLAHIINAEGEKIQAIIHDDKCDDDISESLLLIDRSVQTTLRDVIRKEILLGFKLEDILELIDEEPKESAI